MRRIVRFLVLVLLIVWLGACVAPPTSPSATAMINPGDKIRDFLVTKGEAEDVVYTWEMGCTQQGSAEVYACKSMVGEKVNISAGVYAALSGKTLDSLWAEHTYELLIGDRPVNLAAFGSIDVAHPRVSTMRHWNVVLEAAKPGEITIHDRGKVDGEAFESAMIFTFSPP